MAKFSHLDDEGRARMVDVGGKPSQHRMARAAGAIALAPATVGAIRRNLVKKGDVLAVAQVAGIQAAKRAAGLIPLCHPIALDRIDVRLRVCKTGVSAEAEVRCVGRTGVEMEALTAVSVALLAVYDMCKAIDKRMRIGEIRLVEKTKQ
jgi:cyclic pyranopterin monophosphate synthase